jgi:competence protein ComEA
MSPARPPLGVAVSAPTPLPPPAVVPLPRPPAPDALGLTWPGPAQWALGLLVLLTVGLLAWHAQGRGSGSARPTALERGGAGDVFRIDLNRADRAELLQLPGCGDALSRRILEYRREHGPFQGLDDLRKVHGIGPKTLEKWKDLVYLGGPGPSDDEPTPAPAARSAKQPLAPGETIDVNRAGVEELQRLDGVGPVLAARIVEARALRPFRSADDLRRVAGIGAKTVEKLRPHVRAE